MDFQTNDNQLILENETRIEFDLPIRCAIEILGIVVIALEVPPDQVMNENVFGVSGEGKILWQIERISEAIYHTCSYLDLNVIECGPGSIIWQLEQIPEYKGLSEYCKPDTFLAGNWNGTEAIVDVKTGKVVKTFFLK